MNHLAFLRPSIRVLSVVAVLAASGAGCDTRVLQPYGDGGGPGGGGGLDGTPAQDDGGAAAPVTVPLPAGVTPKPYVSVVHEAGTCDTASDGAPIQTSSAAEVASLLVGRWQICSGSSASLFLAAHDGMEFARDRSWRLLVRDGDALIPGTGFDSAGRWYMSAEDPMDMVAREQSVVRILPDGSGATGYPVQFLQHPTVMRLGHTSTYVWLGE